MKQDRTEQAICQSLDGSSEILKQAQEITGSDTLEKLKKDIISTAHELADTKNKMVYYHEARKLARYELLTPQEQALEKEVESIKADTLQLENIKNSFAAVENEILSAQIEQNQQRMKNLAHDLQATNRRFTTKEWKSKLTKQTRKILAANQPNEQKALELSKRLDELTKQTHTFIINQLKQQGDFSKAPAYSAKEIKAILDPLLVSLQAELKNVIKDTDLLVNKVISYNRAYEMAKNVYAKGGYKDYREKRRGLEKEAQRIENAFDERQQFAYRLSQIIPPRWYHRAEDKRYYAELEKRLADMDRSISLRKHCLKLENEKLEKELSALENRCNTSYAKEKIEKITARILDKNQSYRQELNGKTARSKELNQQILEVKRLKQGVDNQVKLDQSTAKKIYYAVKESGSCSIPAEILPLPCA